MSTLKLVVARDERYPFLTLKPVNEDTETPGGVSDIIEMSGDDFADYEEATRRFAGWQARIADL